MCPGQLLIPLSIAPRCHYRAHVGARFAHYQGNQNLLQSGIDAQETGEHKRPGRDFGIERYIADESHEHGNLDAPGVITGNFTEFGDADLRRQQETEQDQRIIEQLALRDFGPQDPRADRHGGVNGEVTPTVEARAERGNHVELARQQPIQYIGASGKDQRGQKPGFHLQESKYEHQRRDQDARRTDQVG